MYPFYALKWAHRMTRQVSRSKRCWIRAFLGRVRSSTRGWISPLRYMKFNIITQIYARLGGARNFFLGGQRVRLETLMGAFLYNFRNYLPNFSLKVAFFQFSGGGKERRESQREQCFRLGWGKCLPPRCSATSQKGYLTDILWLYIFLKNNIFWKLWSRNTGSMAKWFTTRT